MGKLGETKLAKGTLEEIGRIITEPAQQRENEISFGEFMKVYDPSNESHNFTYLVPDRRNFFNLQIYDTMRSHPFIVLKLEHPLIYQDGLTLEFHFDPSTKRNDRFLGRSIQCSNEFLYNGIMKLEKELYEGWEQKAYPQYVLDDKFRLCLEVKEFFRKEYFPQPIIDAIEKERVYQKSLEGKKASNE